MTDRNRVELDPTTQGEIGEEIAAPPERMDQRRADDTDVQEAIDVLIREIGDEQLEDDKDAEFKVRLARDLLTAGLKLIPDGRDTGELKLMTAAVKELRYAYRVFAQYPDPYKITIFGSARTAEDHPDYQVAVDFSRMMAEAGWMVITGAGDGIMKAGHVGPGREASFGVSIRLPFETTANEVIAGDEKLINFRYFFTRKLMFLSQAEAVALFPGGFGTLDEAFETLTLVQTGKASMMPIVLIEQEGGSYWDRFDSFIKEELLTLGMINPEDLGLYFIAADAEEAAKHVIRFYRNYHSSRYVRDDLVIRLKNRLKEADVERLNEEFGVLIKSGKMVQRGPYDVEDDQRGTNTASSAS